MKALAMSRGQLGGFAMGLIVGLLVGLILALGVALYVTKVPVPFVNKVPQRTAEQDAAEAEKNKNWDPNAGLAGKPVARPASAPAGAASTAAGAGATSTVTGPARSSAASAADTRAATPARPARDPAAILAGQPVSPAASAALPRSTKAAPDPFVYFVQAGAYTREDDAEQQRAKLAMQGFAAKVTEREQSGRTVYRVRLGPFEHRDEADSTQAKIQASGTEAALVRMFR